jgi:hypothetical protein
LETFTDLKEFVANPNFIEQRQQFLRKFNVDEIDPPITELVKGFARLPHCFTLQSCYGHFLYGGQNDDYNIDALPVTNNLSNVDYRIAYIAFSIENSNSGKTLFEDLRRIPEIDSDYIQFGCAEWFWKRQVNSYALQVEPRRYMEKDQIRIGYQEALHIEKIRNRFFDRLNKLVEKQLEGIKADL